MILNWLFILLEQIATLEMKELNEKQRADHIENKCKIIQVWKKHEKSSMEEFLQSPDVLKAMF